MDDINRTGCQADCGTCPPAKREPTPAPDAKEMVKIALGLTIVCAISALITGIAFVLTEPVKKENQLKREETVIRHLLNLSDTATIAKVSRYLITDGQETRIAYQTPASTILFTESGELKEKLDIYNEDALVQKFGKEKVKAVGCFFIGREGSETRGFVVAGSQMGFKNHIKFFLALDDALNVRGIEILEHEEDPGLGAEIVRPYLKNQFSGRTFEEMGAMQVVKEPLPSEWNTALNELEKVAYDSWKVKNAELIKSNQKIYAITGATISTVALTDGVKKTLSHFKKRIDLLRPQL